jgi:hypothetical protein
MCIICNPYCPLPANGLCVPTDEVHILLLAINLFLVFLPFFNCNVHDFVDIAAAGGVHAFAGVHAVATVHAAAGVHAVAGVHAFAGVHAVATVHAVTGVVLAVEFAQHSVCVHEDGANTY